MKKFLPWILFLFPVFVFLQSLPFKFSGAAETVYIFDTLGAWFGSIGLTAIAEPFAKFGAYGVGSVELVASILLLIPATRHWGALIGAGVLSGAIFFHLFTPLGVSVEFPGAAEGGEPALFVMAVLAWSCLVALVFIHRKRYPFVGGAADPAIA
ncbi:MAG: hypothetical protein AAFO81_06955 [Pseudomonadota bacterium]